MPRKQKAGLSKTFLAAASLFIAVTSCRQCPDISIGVERRSGLPGVESKLAANNTVSLVFLGGSITEADGYRNQFSQWLDSSYTATIETHNAGIGGTGSSYGAYRVKRDVIAHRPDIVFIEFAVNDSDESSDDIIRNTESIIRQIKSFNPQTSICLLYTIEEKMLPFWKRGEAFPSVQAIEKVADHYKIPSVNMGVPVWNRVQNETLIFRDTVELRDGVPVFSSDGVHPLIRTGHPIYSNYLCHAFSQIICSTGEIVNVPEPLSENVAVDKQIVKVSPTWFNDHVEIWEGTVANASLGEAYQLRKGDTLSFSFNGSAVGFQDVIGPSTGIIEVYIDGELFEKVNRFDPYCHFYRSHYFFLDRISQGSHLVQVVLSDEPPDKLNIIRRKEKYLEDSSRYKDSEWYVSGVMLEGEIEDL